MVVWFLRSFTTHKTTHATLNICISAIFQGTKILESLGQRESESLHFLSSALLFMGDGIGGIGVYWCTAMRWCR